MSLFPNFREFYQKSLIPIGENDHKYLEEEGLCTNEAFSCTNWYFALEGTPQTPTSSYYQWKAIVYPSNTSSQINYEQPFYTSHIFQCIHEAYDYVKSLETKAKEDILTAEYSEKRKLMA